MRQALCLCLTLGFLWPEPLPAQASDTDVAKGIRQVEQGDYDGAIVTLDGASRRLAGDSGKAQDLSQAYLYLGIAYVGKGYDAAAKAKFREALARIKNLSLSPDKYPPKVINLFEAAKEEANRSTAGPTGASASPSAGTSGGGVSGKWLLIGGGVAAAGGGAYLLTKNSEPTCETVYEERSGIFNSSQTVFEPTVGPAIEAGAWKADVKWTVNPAVTASSNRSALPDVGVKIFVKDPSGNIVTESRLLTDTESIAEWTGAAGTAYRVALFLQGTGSLRYELVVEGPCK